MPIHNARDTFRTGPHKADFERIVQTAAFEAACQAAMLALVEETPTIFATPEGSWQVGVRVSGARRFIEILANLPFPETAPKGPALPTLNYKV